MTSRRERELFEVFHRHDKDSSGTIDKDELRSIFEELGVRKSEKEIEDLVSCVAGSGSGITYPEFVEMFSISRLRDTFREIDADNSGTITQHELAEAMHLLGYELSDEQCKSMLQKVDINGDANITFQEFQQFFENVPLASLQSIADHWTNAVFSTDCGSDLAPTLPVPGLAWWQTVLAGGIGGVAARTLTAPLERVKITAQTTNAPMSILRGLSSIYTTHGVRGLFAGNLTNCVRVFPTAGITCMLYIKLLALTPADAEFDAMEPIYRMSCAGAAALVANTITYPMDIIRARLTIAKSKQSIGYYMSEIISNHGYRGFYRGLRPTLLAVVPFIAIQNTTIDLLRDFAISRGQEISKCYLIGVGAIAGILAQTIVFPLDVIRRRMQVSRGHDANLNIVADRTWLAMRDLVQQHGVRALFAGIVPTFVKTIPAVAIVSLMTQSINMHFKKSNSADGPNKALT